jgi:hypothetical protein
MQLPLSTTFLVAVIETFAVFLLLSRNSNGHSIVERGAERLDGTVRRKLLTRFLALYGATHLAIACLYIAPTQWFALQADAFAGPHPSYMTNGMCVYGDRKNECPGPGISLPRPTGD